MKAILVPVDEQSTGGGLPFPLVRLTHEGFPDEQSRDGHQEAWPMALDVLDKALSTTP